MLKKFFISMLGAMAAFWLSIVILGFVFAVGVGIVAVKALSGSIEVPPSSGALYIDLSGAIPDREQSLSMQDVLLGENSNSDNLADMVNAIRLAANDKDIKGIYIECTGSQLGVASRSEVVEALDDFKKSGKWVYAYADNYMQGDYYIASIADKLYLNPQGTVDVHGMASNTIFFKNLLDKLGIEVDVVKVGTFKSAVEPYIRTSMSEPSKLQTRIFLNQMWKNMTSTIAANRSMQPQDINLWADSLIMFSWSAEQYVAHGVVSELKYRNEFEKLLRDKLGVGEKENLPLITPGEYMGRKNLAKAFDGKPHIAVYYAVGDIVDTGNGGIVGQDVAPEIEKLALDNNVKGLVLRVNSPGGSAFASEQIWHALEVFKGAGKPFYVSMGDYAASGGYYISCGADKIFADPTTITGSIGIFGIIPNAEKLLTDKIGLGFEVVETNPNATFPNLTQRPTPMQLASMQSYVDRGYETFVSRVAKGRDLSIDSVKVIGEGRVWDGETALSIGLVDQLGSLYVAICEMATKLGLEKTDFVEYPIMEKKWYEDLLKELDINAGSPLFRSEVTQCDRLLEMGRNIVENEPLQARMETMIIK